MLTDLLSCGMLCGRWMTSNVAPQYCNCNLLLLCCVCALFLDLIMVDVGSLNDQRILEWSRVGRDVGAVTMSVYVVRLHPPSAQALS